MALLSDDEEGDLAALVEQVSLASAAAISASDLDLAFQLQLSEAIHASLRAYPPGDAASSSSSPPSPQQGDPASPNESSNAAYAFADSECFRQDAIVARARSTASIRVRVAAQEALFARELAAIPNERLAHHSSSHPVFRIFFRGMVSKEVVGPRDWDPGLAVLAVAVCGEDGGELVYRAQKPVDGFVGSGELLEGMALLEGLDAALGLGIRSIKIVTDHRLLHGHMIGSLRVTRKKVADIINQIKSRQRNFEQFQISFVPPTEVGYVLKLARDSMECQISKAFTDNVRNERRETCTICMEDTDVSKVYIVEGCAHRFCLLCMKQHVAVKVHNGMLPTCPQDGCTTELSVQGSKILLSPQLLEIMMGRMRERQIPTNQKIYCPYPQCSALMSSSELTHPMEESSSKYTVADAATLRKCVKCRGSFCIKCKVPWHDRLTCHEYNRRFSQDTKLKDLAEQKHWRQCVRCNQMIELAEGCYHMTCVCGFEFCYTCGKEWKDKKKPCSCPLWEERNIIRDDSEDDYYDEEDDYYYMDEDGI